MANEFLKNEARRAGVRIWRIAEELGISPTTLSIRFRHELPKDEQTKILQIIKKLKQVG